MCGGAHRDTCVHAHLRRLLCMRSARCPVSHILPIGAREQRIRTLVLSSSGMGRKKTPMREKEVEKEDHVRGAEEEVWGNGERGEVPQAEECGGDDDAGGDFSGEANDKRKRGGGGGGGGGGCGGGGKKAARDKNKPATTATAATPPFTSIYRGVNYVAASRKWKARFRHNSTQTSLGYFAAEEDAARAWDRMAVWCHLRVLVKKGPRGKAVGSFTEELNFAYADYKGELGELGSMTHDELVLRLRRAGKGTHTPASSEFRGVCWVRDRRRWQADFKQNGQTTKLGNFVTEDGAARAYDRVMVWFKLHKVRHKGGTKLNFDYAEYEGELEELGRMTQTELVAKLRRHAQAQRDAANSAEGDQAGEGAGGDAGGAELGRAGHDEGGSEGEGRGDGLPLDRAPVPHPNFLRWWRLGPRG